MCVLGPTPKVVTPPSGPEPVGNGVSLESRSIALGRGRGCAVTTDGGVVCFADGLRELSPTEDAVRVSGIVGARSVVVGARHVCVLDEQGISCFGDGDVGQLARRDSSSTGDVVRVMEAGTRTFTKLVAGANFTCALGVEKGISRVWCWGDDLHGALDGARVGEDAEAPRVITTGEGKSVVDIVAGEAHLCALFRDGTMSCRGDDSHGQLGVEERGVVAMGASARGSCAMFQTGLAKCWGDVGRVDGIAEPVHPSEQDSLVGFAPSSLSRGMGIVRSTKSGRSYEIVDVNGRRFSRDALDAAYGDDRACFVTRDNKLSCFRATTEKGIP
jgi:hypothetical protein